MQLYELKSIPAGKTALPCAVFGSGPKPLVILPGLSVQPVTRSAGAVARAFAGFTATHTVFLVDRPDRVEPGDGLKDLADATAAALQALGVAHADVFGASQGGMIAQLLATDYPFLVDALVLASTAGWDNETLRATRARWLSAAEAGDCKALAAAFADDIYGPETLKKYRDGLIALADYTPAELARFCLLCRTLEGMDSCLAPQKIRARCLVTGSAGDRVMGADCAARLAAVIGCPVTVYPPCYGHAVYDEAPEYRQRMLEFFLDKPQTGG